MCNQNTLHREDAIVLPKNIEQKKHIIKENEILMENDRKAIKANFYEDKFYRKRTQSGYRNPKYDQFMRKVNKVCLFLFTLLIGGLILLCIGNAIGIPFIQEWVMHNL